MKEKDIDEMPLGYRSGPIIRIGDKLYSDMYDKPSPMIVRRLYIDQQGSYAIGMSRKDGSGWQTDCGAFWHPTVESWRKARIKRLQDAQQRIQLEINKLLSETIILDGE